MNRRFLAACLYAWAAFDVLTVAIPVAVLAARKRKPVRGAVAVAAIGSGIAVLVNAAADLW